MCLFGTIYGLLNSFSQPDHLDGWLFPYRLSDPRHLVTLEELENREHWPEDWPAPGARDAPIGDVVPDGGGS